MIISHKHKYIFVGIPYSASSAISRALNKDYDGEFVLTKHSNIPFLLEQMKIDLKDYFVFGVYRDPVEILFSRYNKLKNNPEDRFTDSKYRVENGGYVTSKAAFLSKKIRDENISFSGYVRINSQYKGLLMPYDNQFSENVKYFDFVIDFDNLNSDFKTALSKIGINPSDIRDLSQINKTDKNLSYEKLPEKLAAAYFGPFYTWNKKFAEKAKEVTPPLLYKLMFSILRPINSKRLLKKDRLGYSNNEKLKSLNKY